MQLFPEIIANIGFHGFGRCVCQSCSKARNQSRLSPGKPNLRFRLGRVSTRQLSSMIGAFSGLPVRTKPLARRTPVRGRLKQG